MRLFTGKHSVVFISILLVATSFNLASQDIILEAEDAALTGVEVAKALGGYSGSGYVTGFDEDGDQVEFNFEANAEVYELIIGYSAPYGEKGYNLKVNETSGSGMFSFTGGPFAEHEAGKYLLNEGSNIIIIEKSWGWYNIDYVKLVYSTTSPPEKPWSELIDDDAIPSAKALYQYLIDLYGSKVLSGQQTLDDINYIESVTGKSPAVGVFDLIDYSPSRIEHGADPGNSVEEWIAWQKQGDGIVSLSWHWNAPSGLLNTPDHEWWRGFYTHATTFDLEAALADKESEDYLLLIRDMDAIADQLKKFQDEDIPVLWRPLHEASGGWFWWGAKGAGPYQELWRIMVDRYTNHHGLHNLIWVSTHNSNDWYSGDDYVDIVGLDIYTDPSSNMSGEWELNQEVFNGKKLVALSESGTLPNPGNIRMYNTWFSWFSVWSGDFIRDVDQDYLKEVYADDDIITLDELSDWRDYEPVNANMTRNADQINFQVYPNPVNEMVWVQFILNKPALTKTVVCDLSGKDLLQINHGFLDEGSHEYEVNMRDLVAGTYFLNLFSGKERSKSLVVKR